jgi:hypothetical protein
MNFGNWYNPGNPPGFFCARMYRGGGFNPDSEVKTANLRSPAVLAPARRARARRGRSRQVTANPGDLGGEAKQRICFQTLLGKLFPSAQISDY